MPTPLVPHHSLCLSYRHCLIQNNTIPKTIIHLWLFQWRAKESTSPTPYESSHFFGW